MNLGCIGKQFMSIQTHACTCLKLVKSGKVLGQSNIM